MAESPTDSILVRLLVRLIRVYQWQTQFWGPRCRFYPTCSNYMIESLQRWGAWNGLARGVQRLLKCHPWHPGGVDYVEVPHGK